MPPGLARVAVAALGALALAAGAVLAFRSVVPGVAIGLGGALLVAWSVVRAG